MSAGVQQGRLVRGASEPTPLTATTGVAMQKNEARQKAVKISAVDATQAVMTFGAGVFCALFRRNRDFHEILSVTLAIHI